MRFSPPRSRRPGSFLTTAGTLAILFFVLLAAVPTLRAAEAFLPGVKRILFVGDSITYSGEYVDLFELWLAKNQPDRDLTVINVGLPSETVSGLSEPGHAGGKFPRPDLHERLDRVLAKTKPDLVFACYGMNDGIYLPLNDVRTAKFQEGMRWLHDKVTAAGAKIIHLTPAVFDSLPIRDKTSTDGEHGPYDGYDQVLARYSDWLLAQRAEAGWQVIDLHGPMRTALDTQRKANPAFLFSKDGIHPDWNGHRVMATALLTGLGQTAEFADDTPGIELYKLIRDRERMLTNAWLNETGHQRPGMAPGLPLDKAQAKAAEMASEIRFLAK